MLNIDILGAYRAKGGSLPRIIATLSRPTVSTGHALAGRIHMMVLVAL
jgi:hypothetical protein